MRGIQPLPRVFAARPTLRRHLLEVMHLLQKGHQLVAGVGEPLGPLGRPAHLWHLCHHTSVDDVTHTGRTTTGRQRRTQRGRWWGSVGLSDGGGEMRGMWARASSVRARVRGGRGCTHQLEQRQEVVGLQRRGPVDAEVRLKVLLVGPHIEKGPGKPQRGITAGCCSGVTRGLPSGSRTQGTAMAARHARA